MSQKVMIQNNLRHNEIVMQTIRRLTFSNNETNAIFYESLEGHYINKLAMFDLYMREVGKAYFR